MSRSFRSALLVSCLAMLASHPASAAAQKPGEPLGELLDVIPLPEEAPAEASSPADEKPATPRPAPAPSVSPGDVLPVELPPSAVTGEMPAEPPAAAVGESEASASGLVPAESIADPAAAAAAEADAAWEERQEQRRAEINAVESPIVDQLNAEMAARAEAAGRRFADEQAAYEQSLAEREAEIRRREAEHQAEMEAFARRVAREQAAHRARVEACLAGDRDACDRERR